MSKQFINPDGLSNPGTYTHVVVAQGGKMIFVSGQVALDAKGQVVGLGDLSAQTQQVFENLKIALASAGRNVQRCRQANNVYSELQARISAADCPSAQPISVW